MATSETGPKCPHCNNELLAFDVPDEGGWDEGHQFACFNDECPYYQRGWAWMMERYGVTASYRYRINLKATSPSPLAVWSPTALKDRIIEPDASKDGRKDENA